MVKKTALNGRWAIFGLLGLTIFFILIFYLKAELPSLWQRIISPTVISNVPKKSKFSPETVLSEVEELTANLRGTFGVYVYRFSDGQEYGLHQQEIFPAASLMKLPVMILLYQQAEKNQLDLETKYKLLEKDKINGAGVLQSKAVGTVFTYRQMAKYMGQYSDNTAFGVLTRILGEDKIQTLITDLGMKKTSFAENETTPLDMTRLFQQLYKNQILNQENSSEILKFLTKTGDEERIPAGIPEGVRVAHKIGTEIGVFSDGGIVFADKPFILVIMSKNAKESEAVEVLPKIAQAVWEFETKLAVKE